MAKRLAGLVEPFTWVAINWKSWLLPAICLAIGVLSGLAFNSAAFRERLPLLLLALAFAIAVVSLVLSRLCTRRCASCGSSPTDLTWDLDDCPRCHDSYCGAVDLLAGKSVLSLQECLADRSVPLAKAFGIVFTLAIRDGASRIRLVGRKVNDGAEYPWSTPCGAWSVWLKVKDVDYEMVPPPRHVGAGMFEVLQETYCNAEKETPNGPIRLPIALHDWSEDAQLVIEECGQEKMASVIFSSEPREPVRNADLRLREFYSEVGRPACGNTEFRLQHNGAIMNVRAGSLWEHQAFEGRVSSANWQAGLLVLTCVLLTAFGVAGLIFPGLRAWLPHILVLLMVGLPFAPALLSRFYTHRCDSCGSTPMDVVWDLNECPNCKGLFRSVPGTLPRDGVLRLNQILTSSDAIANALGMTIALGMRDAGRELRIAGRKYGDDSDRPWNNICAGWHIWLSLEQSSYEVVPPPRELGSGMFLILREIYRRARKDRDDGRACFRIEVDECSVDAELIIEECEKEKVARIIFESEKPRQEWNASREYFEKALVCVAGSDTLDSTPQATTWKRFPRYLPVWSLVGISLISLAAGIVGVAFIIVSPFSPAGALSISFVVLAASAVLLNLRRQCSHCGVTLCQWPEEAPLLWCPDCRSVFDPSRRALPADGSTLRLEELARSGDSHAVTLVALLDYALNCRHEMVEFFTANGLAEVHLSKGDIRTRVTRDLSYDGPLCFELLAELNRRFEKMSGDGKAIFQVIGRLYQATATLLYKDVDGRRHATLHLHYPDAIGNPPAQPGCSPL